jgi:hypothetical protein
MIPAMPKALRKDARTVKTTVELSKALWQAAKRRALDEGSDLRDIVIAGLKLYLKRPARKGENK